MFWNSKSLAQVWICSRRYYAMLESRVWESQNMAKLKQFEAQVVEMYLIFNLEYRYTVLSRGMQHWLIDMVKSAHRSPQVKILREKLLRTNFVLLEWSSVDLVDQVEHLDLGLGFSGPDRSSFSGPDRSDRSRFWGLTASSLNRPVWPVCTNRATTSF